MDIAAEKAELLKLLLNVEDEQTIIRLKSVLVNDYDFYHDLPEHIKQSIEAGLDDLEKGNIYDHEQVMAEMRNIYITSTKKNQ